MNKEDYYYNHYCSLNEAIYLVVVFRNYVVDSYVETTNTYCFKEYKYAKECYEDNEVGTGYPEIIESRLVEIALQGSNDLDYIYSDKNCSDCINCQFLVDRPNDEWMVCLKGCNYKKFEHNPEECNCFEDR